MSLKVNEHIPDSGYPADALQMLMTLSNFMPFSNAAAGPTTLIVNLLTFPGTPMAACFRNMTPTKHLNV